jgi:formylglycine-generating enzyme required for sulfatase activity
MKRVWFTVFVLTLLLPSAVLAQDPIGYEDANISWPPPVYVLRGSVEVYGTALPADMTGYFLEYRPLLPDLTPDESAVWFPATLPSTQAVENDVLGVWDTTTTLDGLYELRLTVNIQGDDPYHVVVSPLRVENTPPPFAVQPEPAANGNGGGAVPSDDVFFSAGSPNADWTPVEQEFNGVPFVYVPAGCFMMGSEGYADEAPVHEICLDAFWISKTEITNAQYAACVEVGVCTGPGQVDSYNRDEYYGNADFANYPVLYVDWFQALAYAQWLGGTLPTEAQWEYAARGTEGFTYPWGESEPSTALVNYDFEVGDTSLVGSYPKGASWVGAVDMAGNAREWTSSLYRDYPYDPDDGRELLDATIDATRVIRGSTYQSGYASDLRGAVRYDTEPDDTSVVTGIRVVLPAGAVQ